MKTLLMGGALAILVVVAVLVLALSAGGGSNGNSASERAMQKEADIYAISQIERSFHEAISKKNIDQMVGLFAPHATGTFGSTAPFASTAVAVSDAFAPTYTTDGDTMLRPAAVTRTRSVFVTPSMDTVTSALPG